MAKTKQQLHALLATCNSTIPMAFVVYVAFLLLKPTFTGIHNYSTCLLPRFFSLWLGTALFDSPLPVCPHYSSLLLPSLTFSLLSLPAFLA